MIYNKLNRELYSNVKDAAEKVGTTEQSIISNLKDGSFLYVRKQYLNEYIENGIIDVPSNQINNKFSFINYV